MCFISTTGPVLSGIDIPAIPMSIDFCVVFYDREAMVIAMEGDAGTGNSFFFPTARWYLLKSRQRRRMRP